MLEWHSAAPTPPASPETRQTPLLGRRTQESPPSSTGNTLVFLFASGEVTASSTENTVITENAIT